MLSLRRTKKSDNFRQEMDGKQRPNQCFEVPAHQSSDSFTEALDVFHTDTSSISDLSSTLLSQYNSSAELDRENGINLKQELDPTEYQNVGETNAGEGESLLEDIQTVQQPELLSSSPSNASFASSPRFVPSYRWSVIGLKSPAISQTEVEPQSGSTFRSLFTGLFRRAARSSTSLQSTDTPPSSSAASSRGSLTSLDQQSEDDVEQSAKQDSLLNRSRKERILQSFLRPRKKEEQVAIHKTPSFQSSEASLPYSFVTETFNVAPDHHGQRTRQANPPTTFDAAPDQQVRKPRWAIPRKPLRPAFVPKWSPSKLKSRATARASQPTTENSSASSSRESIKPMQLSWDSLELARRRLAPRRRQPTSPQQPFRDCVDGGHPSKPTLCQVDLEQNREALRARRQEMSSRYSALAAKRFAVYCTSDSNLMTATAATSAQTPVYTKSDQSRTTASAISTKCGDLHLPTTLSSTPHQRLSSCQSPSHTSLGQITSPSTVAPLITFPSIASIIAEPSISSILAEPSGSPSPSEHSSSAFISLTPIPDPTSRLQQKNPAPKPKPYSHLHNLIHHTIHLFTHRHQQPLLLKRENACFQAFAAAARESRTADMLTIDDQLRELVEQRLRDERATQLLRERLAKKMARLTTDRATRIARRKERRETRWQIKQAGFIQDAIARSLVSGDQGEVVRAIERVERRAGRRDAWKGKRVVRRRAREERKRVREEKRQVKREQRKKV